MRMSGVAPCFFNQSCALNLISLLNILVFTTRVMELSARFDSLKFQRQGTNPTRFLSGKVVNEIIIEAIFALLCPNHLLDSPSAVTHAYIQNIDVIYLRHWNELLLGITIIRILYYNPIVLFMPLYNLQRNNSKRVMRMYCVGGRLDSIKYYIADEPLLTIFVGYIAMIVLCAYALRILEYQNPV